MKTWMVKYILLSLMHAAFCYVELYKFEFRKLEYESVKTFSYQTTHSVQFIGTVDGLVNNFGGAESMLQQ